MSAKHYLEDELERLLRDDSAIWQFIQQGSLDGVWYWDLENPDQEYMSPEFWRLFGFDPAAMPHDPAAWQDLIFPEDLELAKDNLAKHLADPSHPYDQIVRYRNAGGSTTWVRCRGIAIRDATGKPTRLLGAHNDITDLKAHEKSADRANHLLNTVIDAFKVGVFGLDADGVVHFVNSGGRHMLGGVSDPTPFPWPKDVAFVDEAEMAPLSDAEDPIARALAGEDMRSELTTMTRKAGPARYVRVSAEDVSDKSVALSRVLILEDVTEQERSRQQIERAGRLDALGQLTGGIAHDFNNLLATIQYALKLVELIPDAAKRADYLETAQRSVARGTELTDRLLSFARYQPGRAASKSVKTILEDFGAFVEPLIEADIALKIGLAEDQDIWVYCDTAQLENALLNLVLNSRDAIRQAERGGHIQVHVRPIDEIETDLTRRRETPHTYVAHGLAQDSGDFDAGGQSGTYRYVEFSVSDDGPGMSSEVKRRAVDPFFTTKADHTGTGLGLPLVYGFVQQSKGELRIYSEPEQGSTIRMLLPRGTADGAREDRVPRQLPSQGDGQRILIVEDEPSLLTMTMELVRSFGYEAISANSGSEALHLIEDGTPVDLLITDIVMPGGMSGFELARLAHQAQPPLKIIYMSGYTGFAKEEMQGVAAPMLAKPCPPGVLAKAIETALLKDD